MHRRVLGVVIVALAAAVATPVVSVTTAAPAQAASYRYWSYWSVSNDAWTFAQRGPTGAFPKDGAVQGWRLAVTTDSRSATSPRLPAASAFDSVCGDTPARAGKHRVALVLDFGTAAHARPGDQLPARPLRSECVLLDPGASGWALLVQTGVPIRTDDSGLVCGLAGYPSSGCGERVADPVKPRPTTTSKPKPKPTKPSSTGSGGSSGRSQGADTGTSSTRPPPTGSLSEANQSRSTTRATSSATASSSVTGSPSTTAPTSTATVPAGATGAEPTPTLAPGLPTSADDASSGGPLPVLLGVLVLAAVAIAAVTRSRRSRRGGATP